MPVTVKVAQHDALPPELPTPNSTKDILNIVACKYRNEIGDIIQTSLPDSKLQNMRMSPQDYGLVRAAFDAYSHHQNLVLRPEDIWFAILIQFSYYVNGHAEEMRHLFVAHEGKKGLILRDPEESDKGEMCRNMTKLIDENIIDKELRKWILPAFTTTTLDDEAAAAIIMMGTLKRYFMYIYDESCCGIPSVTLLGEKADWEEIGRRVAKLSKYGKEPAEFGTLLRPVVREMIASFDAPANDEVAADFWGRIVDHRCASGMDRLTGWITVFCFWDEDGKRLAKHNDRQYWQLMSSTEGKELSPRLKDVVCLRLDVQEIPCGFVTTPVIYITPEFDRIEAKVLAGFAGYEVISFPDHTANQLPLDTLRPVTGWWMYEDKNAKGTGSERLEFFYKNKLANEWKGGASTGYVSQEDGSVRVEQGLPRY
ncbi:hypothetical protein CC80DRAFT_481646 [Byssothecium circinans]|uniref:Uncharacterized protein n=1 Tax=Byssothecium circinans TaxID=147558 RepID=A0A6A5TEH4_9PLEO|nr:hypothetical protein CC80DRAFT_481646 [Byssothecium circinans]